MFGTKDFTVHQFAQFLPWHRYFIHLYEQALKQQCGYTGNMMYFEEFQIVNISWHRSRYWDWTINANQPSSASIWSNQHGLGVGGNGTDHPDPLQRCIKGPFENLRPHFYGGAPRPHCITRSFQTTRPELPWGEMYGNLYSNNVINDVFRSDSYLTFRPSLEAGPHNPVHAGIGGDMGPVTSPNGKFASVVLITTAIYWYW